MGATQVSNNLAKASTVPYRQQAAAPGAGGSSGVHRLPARDSEPEGQETVVSYQTEQTASYAGARPKQHQFVPGAGRENENRKRYNHAQTDSKTNGMGTAAANGSSYIVPSNV